MLCYSNGTDNNVETQRKG